MQLKFQGSAIDLKVSEATTLESLRTELAQKLALENASIRLLGGGKSIKPDHPGTDLVHTLFSFSKPVMVLAIPRAKIEEMHSADAEHDRQVKRRIRANETLGSRVRKPASTKKQLEYTFSDIKALPYGNQEGAQQYLERIKNDKAVQALMAKHRLKVGLLTELDPSKNTEIDHRKLGLNKNGGEIIYLRIRTDDYEGFCNYNEILPVLCHELAHNIHQNHSPQFWEVCRQYEKDIKDLNPWKGGHSLH